MIRVYCDRCNAIVEEDSSVKKEYNYFHRPTLFSGSTVDGENDWILCRDCAARFRKLVDKFYELEDFNITEIKE